MERTGATPPMSTRLQLVTSYLIVSGVLALGFALYQFLNPAEPLPSNVVHRKGLATAALAAVGCLWLAAGVSLARRRRSGVVLATVAVMLQVVSALQSPGTFGPLAFSFVALGAVASTWREMTP